MSKENVASNQSETKTRERVETRFYKTHFSFDKIPLREDGFDSGYEWVHAGNGRWIRVRKKPEDSEETDFHLVE